MLRNSKAEILEQSKRGQRQDMTSGRLAAQGETKQGLLGNRRK